MNWFAALLDPVKFAKIVSELYTLAKLVVAHPEYGEKANELIGLAAKYFPAKPKTPPDATNPAA
jgi:hypothetical protein